MSFHQNAVQNHDIKMVINSAIMWESSSKWKGQEQIRDWEQI
jgi:hypothetical protein